MFSQIFTTALLAGASLVQAMPAVSPRIPGNEFIVFSPQITYPTAGVQLAVASRQNVTWDTSNFPPEAVNNTGLLLLGQQTSNSENLDITHPLATNFPLSRGYVEVTIPNKPDADNYIMVLFGDSGNTSPQFSIVNGTATTNSTGSTSSSSVPSESAPVAL